VISVIMCHTCIGSLYSVRGIQIFRLERPQFCHHVSLDADRLLWYLALLVFREEQMFFQLHRDGGVLLDLPPRLALE